MKLNDTARNAAYEAADETARADRTSRAAHDVVSEPCDMAFHGAVLVDGVEKGATVCVKGGLITGVYDDPKAVVDAKETVELADDEVLIPGIVDTHVHINEPGRTEWEGFDCATRAAAAGGITTVIDMPLNSNPPTMTVDALNLKRSAARSKAYTQLGFWGGVDASNLGSLEELWNAGVFGFKCFLSASGVDEYGSLTYGQVREAMQEIASFDGQLIVHAEDPSELAEFSGGITDAYASFEASRPGVCEATAVERIAALAAETGCRTHVLHVSSRDTIGVVADAKTDGVPLTAETCPHYLTLDCDRIPDGNTAFKCCPPIRSLRDQDALWQALVDGVLDIVVTDHSPTTAQMKAGSLATAWGGVSSLQVGFRAVLTEARRRGLGLAAVVRWMSANTASFVGLADRGAIAPGKRADLAIIKPDATWTVRASELESRNPISAFDGMTLNGVVSGTFVGGEAPSARAGHLVSRPAR